MSRESDELTPEPLVPEPNEADLVHPVVSDPFSLEGGAPPADEPAPQRRMRRAWGRGLAGVAVSAVAVAGVLAGSLAPWPDAAGEAASLDVTPAPSETVLACDGPVLALGRDATAAGAISVAGPADLTAGTASGAVPEPEPLAQPAAEGEQPQRFVQVPVDRTIDPIAAASSAQRTDGDLTGFAASACRAPALESWIVGGDTGVGESDILLLANPTDAAATVELTVFGATEPVTPPGYGALAIPPATQVAVPLAGVAGAEAAPVIRVTATGSPVRAALQSSLVRTLDPAGLDRQSAVTSASRQVFAGVVVTEEAAGGDGAPVILRLLGRSGGTASITATPEGETVSDTAPIEVPYEADRPVSVELGDLPAGRYTVTVSASEPVVAAAWQTTGFGQGVDFAWQTPSPEVTTPTLVAVPDGPEPTLHLTGPAEADVTLTDADGRATTVAVSPEGTSVPLEPDTMYTVDSGGAMIHGAVSYLGDQAIASIPLWPDPAAPEPVTVYPSR